MSTRKIGECRHIVRDHCQDVVDLTRKLRTLNYLTAPVHSPLKR
jgi:hypothetical protein